EAKGKAEAAAIKAKGEAEAEAMNKKAEAYKKYNNAAIAEMMLNILPQMAEQIAKPLSQIKDINIYGGSVSDGVSQISGNSPAVIKQVFDTVSKATGVELSEVLKAETYAAKVDKNINAKIDTESNEKETAEIS
ncbi:flotillin family protein, partial [bacterium]|nr:flotillin family protein [bacterium]